MALKGTLKDFSVADIFQLIGQQQKSGSLYIRNKDKEAHVLFDAGKVVLGTFRKSDEDFLLGTMLLRANVISSEQLQAAMDNQKITMRSLGDILKTMGVINNATLSEFVNIQLKEVLFRVFQWKDGLYEFVAEQIPFNKTVIKPQSAEGVLMDGFRMLDEWPKIQQTIPSMEIVYRPIGAIEGNGDAKKSIVDPIEAAFGDSLSVEEEAPDEDQKVLKFFDGRRSLQEVIYLTRLGTFDACRIAASLLDRKRIEKVDELSQTKVDSKALLRQPSSLWDWAKISMGPLTLTLLLAIFIPLALFRFPSHWNARYQAHFNPNISLCSIRDLMTLAHIHDLLNLYRLEQSRYPASLEDVLEPKMAKRWNYQLTENEFTILPSIDSHE